MTDSLIFAAAALGVTAMLCLAASRAWRGWLELAAKAGDPEAAGDEIGVRIELAAVRERLKKLEAIASGVEL